MRDGTLGAALVAALAEDGSLPHHLRGVIVLRAAGQESWTLRISAGRPALAHGEDEDPDTLVTADLDTLHALAAGRLTGVEAFLDGRLLVRGNLALSLRLAGLLGDRPDAPAHVPSAREVDADGHRTFYLEAGAGTPVILLHGLGATNASMLPTLQDFARDHRVIAPDLPGFGESAKPLRPLHAAFYSRWLAALMDALEVDRAHLVGNSMGGRIAVEVGLRHPERVNRIGLLAPSPAFLKRRDHVRVVRLLRPELAVLPIPLPRRQVVSSIRWMFARPDRLSRGWHDAAADEFLRVFNTPRGRICFFSAARQIYLEDPHDRPGGFWARLPELEPPALFVWGSRDRLVPAGFAPHVERVLPAATSVVLPDCGHVPQFELPERTHGLLREFFGAV